MRSRSALTAAFGLLQVLGCCCAFGGYPGTFYQMMLRLNKERKYARTAPSPARLWAVLNPAATLGSLSNVPLDSNRVVRRDLEPRQVLGPPAQDPAAGESEPVSEGLDSATIGLEPTSGGISEGLEAEDRGPESISEASDGELETESGGSRPTNAESDGGLTEGSTLPSEGSELTNEEPETIREEPELTSEELEPTSSTAGLETTSGGSNGISESSSVALETRTEVSEPTSEVSDATSGSFEATSGPLETTSGGSVTTSGPVETISDASVTTRGEPVPSEGLSDTTNGAPESTTEGSQPTSVTLESTSGDSELPDGGSSMKEKAGASCGGDMVMPSPPASLTPTQGFTLKQNISTPGWEEGRYPEEVECVWNLKVGPECEVGLLLYQVLEGEVLQTPRCIRDYLEFVQPNSHSTRYCGPLVNNRDKVSGIDSWHSSQERNTTIRFRSMVPGPLEDSSYLSGAPRGFVMEVTYYCWLYNKAFVRSAGGDEAAADEGEQDMDGRREQGGENSDEGSGDNNEINTGYYGERSERGDGHLTEQLF